MFFSRPIDLLQNTRNTRPSPTRTLKARVRVDAHYCCSPEQYCLMQRDDDLVSRRSSVSAYYVHAQVSTNSGRGLQKNYCTSIFYVRPLLTRDFAHDIYVHRKTLGVDCRRFHQSSHKKLPVTISYQRYFSRSPSAKTLTTPFFSPIPSCLG